MPLASDQWRLLLAAVLCALPPAVAYRVFRRRESAFDAVADAILAAYLIQYVSVGVAGLLGILTLPSIAVICLTLCGGCWLLARFIGSTRINPGLSRSDRRWLLGAALAAIGFVAAFAWQLRFEPPLATDALVYHLPAAVDWLQQHRITLYQVWFFNPANTFSPLAGSIFATWLLAPMENDSLVRFMQIGPWILTLLAAANLARNAGAGVPVAALAAFAAVVSRPFLSEAVLVKDDLFVVAFFLVGVRALLVSRPGDQLAPLRAGAAFGLMLSMKYTVILSAPVLLLAADAPFRNGWRLKQFAIGAGAVLLIAGPWYLRNLWLFGNPVFPMKIHVLGMTLPGNVPSVRVLGLRSLDSTWQILTGGYFALPSVLFVFLSVAWLAAAIRYRKVLLQDPLKRFIILGPPAGIGTYILFSPQAEVRFLYPAFALMFAAAAIALPGRRGLVLASVMATIAVGTSFVPEEAGQIFTFAVAAAALALAGLLVVHFETEVFRLKRPLLTGGCVTLLFLLVVAQWPRYVREYRDGRFNFWQAVYPTHGPVWEFVDANIPAGATIAYSNQFMTYPLCGFEHRRRVVYAPVRAGASVSNLVFPDRLTDGEFFNVSLHAANVRADRSAWLANLRATGAGYLLVGADPRTPEAAPELDWAEADPEHFTRLFANEQAAVYRIHLTTNPGE
jgi:hypothetical protein